MFDGAAMRQVLTNMPKIAEKFVNYQITITDEDTLKLHAQY
jgi:hypothetical protein